MGNRLTVVTRGDELDTIGLTNTNSYAEAKLQEILRRSREATSHRTNADLDELWNLFVQIRKAQTYAKAVFRALALSPRHLDLTRALSAFRLMDEESKASEDYEKAVRVALKTNNHRIALSLNDQATQRDLQDGCSVLLLLHSASNQLWNTAARVWETSIEPTFNHKALSYAILHSEIGNYRDLPDALYRLGLQLRDGAPIIMQQKGTMTKLINVLSRTLFGNGRLMSIITPQGLQNLLDLRWDLRLLASNAYINAIHTINRSAVRSDKGLIADMIYNRCRSDLPEWAPPSHVFGSLLSIHYRQRSPAKVYDHYLNEFAKFHGQPDPYSFQISLSALSAQGDVDRVQSLFLRFCQAHGRPQNADFYNPLLYVHARLGDVAGTRKEFERMVESGAEPDAYSWNILIYAHARSPQPECALKVFEMMKQSGATPDVYTFVTLMSIYAKIGDTTIVLDLLEQAQQYKVQGSYALVTCLVQSYLVNNQGETAERVAKTATNAGFQGYPTTMWNYLLRHYAFLADSKSMLRVQRQMTALSVSTDAMTHAAFMTALVRLGKTRDALEILRTLNLSQAVAATSFHYAILLYGFASEGDRDMATVIYHEMVERFPSIGASAHLSMLHLQARRNVGGAERPEHAALYLADVLHELSIEDRASRQPQPGLRRRRTLEATPSLFVEYFVDLLLKKGQVKAAGRLVQQFEELADSSYLHLDDYAVSTIPFLTARLALQAAKQEWAGVDATWNLLLERGILKATPTISNKETEPPTTQPLNHDTDNSSSSSSIPILPVGDIGLIEKNFASGFMRLRASSSHSIPNRPGLGVLPSQRYVLELPLSRYLDTLATRHLQDSATALVEKMEKIGFALTSRNWNMYIQTLTRSEIPRHWILACQVFERKMIQHTPPWSALRRGEWLPPPASITDTSIPVSRKSVEKHDPGQLMPTYHTAVHLARVLLSADRIAEDEQRKTKKAMLKVAPLTCRFIRRIPYSNDPVQNRILRERRKVVPARRYRHRAKTDRAGVLGSKSPLYHLPAEESLDLTLTLKKKDAGTDSSSDATRILRLRRARLHHRQGRLGLLAPKRRAWETDEEYRRRRKRRNLRRLHAIRRHPLFVQAVSDPYFGHPTIPITTSAAQQPPVTLLGTEYKRLVKQGEHVKGREARRRALPAIARSLSSRRR